MRTPSDQSTDRFRQAFDRSPAIQLLVGTDTGRVVEANTAALHFHGCAIDRIRQLRLAELLIAPGQDGESIARDLLTDRIRHVHVRQRDGEGRIRHVEIDAARIDGDGRSALLHTIFHDTSARVGAESRLQVYSEFYENLPVPLYRATRGATGKFIRFNPAFLRLFEADRPEQLFERNISELYEDPRERERFSNALMHNGEVRRYELRLRTFTGRVIQCIDTAYQHEDETGQIVFDGVLEDVTRQRELERELEYQARYDELTGLANRRHCDTLLRTEVERCERYGQPLSMLMLDLDHFKHVNDEHGHAAGDELLKQVARCIGEQLRRTDVAARWGGEEFVVLLPATRLGGATQLAEKLRAAVSRTATNDGHGVTASIGCGEYVRGEARDAFLRRLDGALYAAKDAGRDRVCKAVANGRDERP